MWLLTITSTTIGLIMIIQIPCYQQEWTYTHATLNDFWNNNTCYWKMDIFTYVQSNNHQVGLLVFFGFFFCLVWFRISFKIFSHNKWKWWARTQFSYETLSGRCQFCRSWLKALHAHKKVHCIFAFSLKVFHMKPTSYKIPILCFSWEHSRKQLSCCHFITSSTHLSFLSCALDFQALGGRGRALRIELWWFCQKYMHETPTCTEIIKKEEYVLN